MRKRKHDARSPLGGQAYGEDVRVRVSDVQALPGLISHLLQQGFPATPCGHDEVEVLFPAQPALFEAAAELDLWRLRNSGVSGVTVVPLPEVERMG